MVAIFQILLTSYKNRFNVETSTPALRVVKRSDGGPDNRHPYLVYTPRGNIQAKHVVYCSEAHAPHLLPQLRGIIYPLRRQMSVQQADLFPVEQAKYSWGFIYQNTFDYMSQSARTGEIYLGGGTLLPEEGNSQFLANPSDEADITSTMHLKGVVSTVFGVPSVETKSTWTGIMGFSLDKLPLVGRLPASALVRADDQPGPYHGQWIAAGFGGYGMVNSWLSGQALAERVPRPNGFHHATSSPRRG